MSFEDKKAQATSPEVDKPGVSEGNDEDAPKPRFSPEEEQALLAESNDLKTEANAMFATSRFRDAVDKYNEAIAVCPNYLDYELAVLRSNISACHLKLEEWKEAIKSATEALEGLDRLEAEEAEKKADENAETAATPVVEEGKKAEEEEVEKEIVSRGASKAGPMLSAPSKDEGDEKARKRQEDILRIRAKALMRRARARSELGGWSNLAGAMEDYNRLATMTNLGPADRKIVVAQLKVLPARTKAAQAKETAEMWAKLKELGNGLLKPFGLSTDNFKMTKDEKTGGYSMNFQSTPGK